MTNINNVMDLFKGLKRLMTFSVKDVNQNLSMGSFVSKNAQLHPDKIMIATQNKNITYGEFNQRANQYAHFLKSQGVKQGDTVALLIENEAEMLATLVGICKLGAIAGLININLKGSSLIHCIKTLKSTKVVFSGMCIDSINDIKDTLSDYQLMYIAPSTSEKNENLLDWITPVLKLVNAQEKNDLQQTLLIPFTAPAYYVFTSGTTGLPKAAVITHFKWYRASLGVSKLLMGLKPSDRTYVCLPMFHISAMFFGFGAATMTGSSFYLAKKFSVNGFWKEVRDSKSNIFLYIGELCRYLLNAPEQADDKHNPLVACVGNGLRPEIWHEFKERFGIKKVGEYYGSTEGNAVFMNVFNKDTTFGMGLGNIKVLKYNEDTAELVRDKQGFCIPVNKGETGLLVSEISDKTPFNGYTDKAATQSKILGGVMKKGDNYFNTGDLIRSVKAGFTFGISQYQFVDRLGDTFRWKGENVSTNEVADIINEIDGVMLSSVYGVQIPNTDGRAGMVSLVVEENTFCWNHFSKSIAEALPSYARPIFVRILQKLETTDTHKIKKTGLQNEGFNIDVVQDRIWIKAPHASEYIELNADTHRLIISGNSGF